jgi:hypothetical protein
VIEDVPAVPERRPRREAKPRRAREETAPAITDAVPSDTTE